MGSSTPRTSHRPSVCGIASEVRSAGISADAALVAIVRIAAEPIVIAVSGVGIGLDRIAALRSRDGSLRGRCGCAMRHVAPLVMMTGPGALSPGGGHCEDGAHRGQQISGTLHEALLRPRRPSHVEAKVQDRQAAGQSGGSMRLRSIAAAFGLLWLAFAGSAEAAKTHVAVARHRRWDRARD